MTRTIAFLVFDQFQLLDATGPIAAFEMPVRGIKPAPYRIRLIAREAGLVTSSSGVAVMAEAMGQVRNIDTLIVAGGEGTRAPVMCPETLAFVRRQAQRARRICSVCSGAYVLAEAGVLDGRRATTHWRRSAHFARRYPRVQVQADRIYIEDGPFWTSAGITAGIDLALALIGQDLGEEVARRVARELVVHHRRPGGQSQFSVMQDIAPPQGRFALLMSWMREHLSTRLDVESLAAQVHMSPRHFARSFMQEVGMTPAKAVEKMRLEAARILIDGGASSLDRVAHQTGFGDPERMRRAFLRGTGQPPQALRRQARQAA